jgi:hypothetical protein
MLFLRHVVLFKGAEFHLMRRLPLRAGFEGLEAIPIRLATEAK